MAITKKWAAAAAASVLLIGSFAFALSGNASEKTPSAPAAKEASSTIDPAVLRVGSLTVYPPFEFVDAKTGNYEGFDMDLIREVGRRLNKRVEIVSMGLDAIVPAILAKNVDLGVSAFSITPERSAKVNFTKPYYDAGLTVMTYKDNEKKINSVKDLEGKCLCAEIGSSGALYSKRIPGVTVRTFNSAAEAFLELNKKGCEAMINDRPVNEYFLAQPASKSLSLVERPVTLTTDQYGIAVAKDNTKLLAEVNAALDAIRADGTYDKIMAKWFKAAR